MAIVLITGVAVALMYGLTLISYISENINAEELISEN